MMENYDRTVELMDTAYESAGRGEEQFSKSQDTLQAKLNTLANTWEQFRLKFFNQDFFKGLIDNVNKLLDMVSNFDTKKVLSLAAIGVTLGKVVVTGFIDQIKAGSANVQTAWNKFINMPLKDRFKWNDSLSQFGVGQKTQRANAINTTLANTGMTRDTSIDLSTKANQQKTLELNKQLQTLRQLKAELDTINNSERNATAEDQEQLRILQEQVRINREKANQLLKELGYEKEISLEDAKQLSDKINENPDTQPQIPPAGEKMAGSLSSGLTTGIAAGLTTAIMTAISTGDVKEAFKVGLITLATTALSVILPTVIEIIITFLSGGAGLVLIGAVIIAGIVSLVKEYKKAQDKAKAEELERLRAVGKTNEELQKQQQQILSDLKKARDEKDTFETDYDRYQYLSKKSDIGVLTTAETEEMKNLAKGFNDNYSDIVRTYDENTGKIEFNTYALENLNNTLQENVTKEKANLQTNSLQQLSNYNNTVNKVANLQESALRALGRDNFRNFTNLSDEEKDTILNRYTGADVAENAVFDLARIISSEAAKSVGMDENLYNKVIKLENINDFEDALFDAGVSIDKFSEQVLQASYYQSGQNVESRRAAGANVVESALVAADVDEKVIDILASDAAADKLIEVYDKGFEKIAENTQNQIFSDYHEAYNDWEGHAYDAYDFLEDVKEGTQVQNLQNMSEEEYFKYWGELGVTKTGEEENAIKFSELFDSGTNLIQYEKLPSQIKAALEALYGTDAESRWDEDDASDMIPIIEQLISYRKFLDDGGLQDLVNTEDYKKVEDGVIKFSDYLQSYGDKTIVDWEKGLENSVKDIKIDEKVENEDSKEAIKGSINIAQNKVQEEINNQVNDLVAFADDDTYDSSYIKTHFTGNTIAALNQQLSELGDATSTQRKRIFDEFAKDTENLTNEQKNILASIKLDSSYEDLMKAKDSYVKSLTETGMSIEEASRVYENYISSASQILARAVLGKEGIASTKAAVNSFFGEYDEKYELLFSGLEEFYEEGKLKSSTAIELMNSDFAEYVKLTKDGYTLMADAAEQYYVTMANQPIDMVERQIKDNKAILEDTKNLYDEVSSIPYLSGLLSPTTISKVKDKTLDETGFRGMVGSIRLTGTKVSAEQEDNLWNLLTSIANSTQDTVEGYMESIQEYIDTAQDYLPEVHLQKLIALQEHYIDMTEDVEDLEEELEDLQGDLNDLNADLEELNNDLAEQNEELIENQKAIDDAYKAWQEAIHGTANFQSSIDGLVNYNNLLSETERNITKIKEGLDEIDSVNQGAQSLQQLKSSTETQLGQLGAQRQVIDNAMANVYGNLIANYGDFTQFDQNGMLAFDFSIENADMPDALKEGYQDLIEQYNDFVTQKQDIQDQEDSINKEYLAMQEQFVDARVTMEQKIIEVLKNQQQEEVDQVKEKYDALKEQDDEYIDALEDAIKKQRDLREQETKYEDLAQKQKKLSLMQRDTSGANQKEVQSLEDEVQKDRQDLLNDEVDNIIDSLKELYEKQTEARELEIQAMEKTIEDMSLLNEMAQNIMAGFQNSDDIISWFVGNNAEVDDMTVNQTEQYINEVRKDSSQFLTAVAAQTEDVTLDAQNVADTSQEVFDSVSQGITDVGDVTQATAEKTAQEAIDSAREAYDNAVQAMNDTQAKIEETRQKINDTNNEIIATQNDLLTKEKEVQEARRKQNEAFKSTMDEMISYSSNAVEEVAEFATNFIIEAAGNKFDLSTTEGTSDFLTAHGLVHNGKISRGTYEALRNYDAAIGDNVQVDWGSNYVVWFDPPVAGAPSERKDTFSSRSAAEAYIANQKTQKNGTFSIIKEPVKYAKGGLVNYTGPAWVDGTKSAPEAFLSAEDTRRIGEAAQILAQIPALQSTSTTSNISTTNVGDTTIEIHLNIDKIANDYDIDQMVNRLKRDIVDISNGVGSSVILKK